MFPMHETTRRRICRGSFVLLCALPTLGTLAFGLSRQLPSHTRAVEEALSVAVGLNAHFDALSHPRPERLRVRGLELRNPETGAWVLRTPQADVEQHSGGP